HEQGNAHSQGPIDDAVVCIPTYVPPEQQTRPRETRLRTPSALPCAVSPANLVNFICDRVVPPLRHVAPHVLNRCHAYDLASVRLPQRRVLGRAALLSFHKFMQTLLVKVDHG